MSSALAPFVARPSIPKRLLLVGGSILFVIGGAWIAGLFGVPPRAGREWAGYLSIVFFGLCAIIGVRSLFDRDDQICLSPSGFYSKQWSDDVIPWAQVRNIYEANVRRQRFLCIDLVDPARYPSNRLLGRLGGMNRGMGFGDLALVTTSTDKSFHEVAEAVFAYWEEYGRNSDA